MANSRSEQYLNAMKDVTENSMSVREAARKWGVPKSSLYDRLSGKVEYYRRSGPPTVLTKHEEGRIADWLLEMEQRCCLFSKNDIFDHVKKMLDNDDRETPFIDNRPGEKPKPLKNWNKYCGSIVSCLCGRLKNINHLCSKNVFELA